jgi:L-2-hydroxyglutarate oxidase LhgO
MESVECVVVGAGVIGLGIARALAEAGREVLVLERNGRTGEEVSSRNSEVVHGGMYYATGSNKARLCVAGRRQLYAYCDSRGVPYRRLGKLIVASGAAQRAALDAILAQGRTNGLDDLRLLDAAAVAALEPAVVADSAILSPSTGIVDSHAFMLALQGDAETAGASVVLHTPVERGEIRTDGFLLETGGAEPTRLLARILVNAAGLGAWDVARRLAGYPEALIPPRVLARGVYFGLALRSPFHHLIYPVPESGGLGVHVTLDLAGRARFGPDVEWIDEVDYQLDARRAELFYPAIRRDWPELPDGALLPDYTGIRPRLGRLSQAAADFRIDTPATHGIPGLVQLFGIESPGLTATLALADEVAAALAGS